MFHLGQFTDWALLFLRLMAGLIFADSGYEDLKDPEARSKSIETPKPFTIFLGVAEVAGGIAVIVGVFQQLAAIGLILIMLGALQKKLFVWKTGFWGKDGGLGVYYELTLISMLLVILVTDGGRFVILP
jgi:putative oxidoreductase